MGLVVNSTNVATFEILTQYDVSGLTITLTNQTTYQGGGAAATEGIDFKLTSPSGLVYYENTDWGVNSDITPSAPTTPFTYTIPQFNGFAEIGTWTMQATIRDDSTNYTLTYTVNICKPSQCSTQTSTFDGCAVISFVTDCNLNKTIYEDVTVMTYQGLQASSTTYSGQMSYPLSSGLSPLSFDTPFFSTSPIYSGLYSFTVSDESTYYFTASNTNVVITYTTNQTFEATCLVSLCGIECVYAEWMEAFLASQNAGTGSSKLSKYSVNNAILLTSLIQQAQLKYSCGEDLSAIIEEIEAITGKDCSCNCGGQNNARPVVTSQEIAIQSTCGDITVSQSTAGLTTTYTINDVSYVVESSSSGVTVTETTDSGTCTKTYSVDVCLEDLALCGSVFPIEDGNGSTVNMGSGSTYEQIVSAQNSATTVIEGRLDALEAAPTWTNIANGDMSNSWVNLAQVSYTKDINGWVTMRGSITKVAAGASSVCFTMPSGYRPSQISHIASSLIDNGGFGSVYAVTAVIQTSGVVTINYNGGGSGSCIVGLETIRFNVNA